jgi:ectoine hydroxylase-related dioxygenase (phytanoyl-CoA dioxygenase family)
LLSRSTVAEELRNGQALAWLKSINEQGFAIIPDVLTVGDAKDLLEDLAHVALRRSKAGIRHLLGYAPVAVLAQEPRLIEIARAVLGSDAFPFRATLFDKSPDANWLVMWHQDQALPLRERREMQGWGPWSIKKGILYANAPARALWRVMALRVHLDDSTTQNGPLLVIPGSHAKGLCRWSYSNETNARSLVFEVASAKRKARVAYRVCSIGDG